MDADPWQLVGPAPPATIHDETAQVQYIHFTPYVSRTTSSNYMDYFGLRTPYPYSKYYSRRDTVALYTILSRLNSSIVQRRDITLS